MAKFITSLRDDLCTGFTYLIELEDFHEQHYSTSQEKVYSENFGVIAKCSQCNQKNFYLLDLMDDKDEAMWKAVQKYRSFFTGLHCHNCERKTNCEVRHLDYNQTEKLFSSISSLGETW